MRVKCTICGRKTSHRKLCLYCRRRVARLQSQIAECPGMTVSEWACRWHESVEKIEDLLASLMIYEDELGGIYPVEED